LGSNRWLNSTRVMQKRKKENIFNYRISYLLHLVPDDLIGLRRPGLQLELPERSHTRAVYPWHMPT